MMGKKLSFAHSSHDDELHIFEPSRQLIVDTLCLP